MELDRVGPVGRGGDAGDALEPRLEDLAPEITEGDPGRRSRNEARGLAGGDGAHDANAREVDEDGDRAAGGDDVSDVHGDRIDGPREGGCDPGVREVPLRRIAGDLGQRPLGAGAIDRCAASSYCWY